MQSPDLTITFQLAFFVIKNYLSKQIISNDEKA